VSLADNSALSSPNRDIKAFGVADFAAEQMVKTAFHNKIEAIGHLSMLLCHPSRASERHFVCKSPK
jgi:hypothetical protein